MALRRAPIMLCALVMALSSSPASSTETQLATPAPSAGDASTTSSASVTLNMRDADIRAMVHWLSDITGKRFVIDPRVKGQMTVLAKTPLTVEQAYKVVVDALQVHGFATIDDGTLVRIVPDNLAKSQPGTLSAMLEETNASPGMTTYVLPLNNVPAAEIVRQLKPLIPPAGHIAALATDTLLLIDSPDNIKRLNRLASYIDQQGAMTFEIYPLNHAQASSARDMLRGLTPDGRNAEGIAVDLRTNSLLLSGNASQRRQWRQLLASLDQPHGNNGSTQVFYLHYLQASELLPVLRGVTTNLLEQQSSGATGQVQVSIEALDPANAIIANGPQFMLDEIGKVIKQTDFRRAQVLVDAIIVEVSDDFAREIGVQWQSGLNDGVIAASRFDGGSFVDAGKFLLGQGLSLGFLKSGDLRFLLNAIATQVDANVLSQPSIVTLDNEAAEILVGQNIPLITGQSTSEASPTDNPFTTVERKDIGITLKVTPQVNEGDAITLDVVQEVENVSPSASSEAKDTVTTKRSVKTKVIVEDQGILVLGGLIDTSDQETIRKIPLLGDIPLLGALFRNKQVEQLRRNLMVFIRPTILQEDTGRLVSEQRYERMRKRQQEARPQSSLKREPVLLPEYETFAPQR